jgi:hypothetical protein
MPSKVGVELGVVRGAELPDPSRLLEGNGKVHRYIRFREKADHDGTGVEPLR